MRTFIATVLLLSVIGNTNLASAHPLFSCEALNQGNLFTVPPKAPSVCAHIVDYTVAVPLNSCQSKSESAVGSLPTVNTLLTGSCKIALNIALCSKVFPKCRPSTLTDDYDVDIFPCRSLCQNVLDSCGPTDMFILENVGIKPQLDCQDASWSSDSTCNTGPSHTIGTPQVQEPRCADYSGTVCAGSIPTGGTGKVYIPAGFTEEALENAMKAQQFTFAISSRTATCDVHQQAWACANTFMECEQATLQSFSIPVPKLPCKSLCNAYKTSCATFFQLDPQLDYAFNPDCDKKTFGESKDCAGQVDRPGSDNFPTSKTLFLRTVVGDVESTCSNWSSEDSPTIAASSVTHVNAVCPAPLVEPESDEDHIMRIVDGSCSPSCPLNLWTEKEYHGFDAIFVIGSLFSFLCSLFFVISWNLFKWERKSSYYLYMNYCLATLYFFLLVNAIRSSAMGADHITQSMCKNNAEEYHMNGYCVFQGALFIFLVLASASWWLVQAMDIFRILVLNIRFAPGSPAELRLNIAYHIFSWVPAGIATILALALDQVGAYAGGTPWCFFSQGRYAKHSVDISQGLFYFPMFAYTVVGCILMIAAMIRIWLISRQKENQGKSFSDKYMCNVYFRIFAYFFIMATVWFYLFAYKIYAINHIPMITQSTTRFYVCLLFSGSGCGEIPDTRIPYGMMALLVFFTTFTGVMAFFIHGTTFSIYRSWAGFIYDKLLAISPKAEIGWCKKYSLKIKQQQAIMSGSAGSYASTGSGTASNVRSQSESGRLSHVKPRPDARKAALFKGSTAASASGRASTRQTVLVVGSASQQMPTYAMDTADVGDVEVEGRHAWDQTPSLDARPGDIEMSYLDIPPPPPEDNDVDADGEPVDTSDL